MIKSIQDKKATWKSSILLLLFFNILFRLWVALKPLPHIDGVTIPDDAYLSLTIARNIARGLGPLYGLDYTNGFQPLYVFLTVPIYWLFPGHPETAIYAALILLALFDTATLYFLIKIVKSLSASGLTSFIMAISWIFNSYVLLTVANGLETSIALFFVIASFYFYLKTPFEIEFSKGLFRTFCLGALLGLALLARIDNIFFAVAMIFYVWIQSSRISTSHKKALISVAALISGILFAYIPWLSYSYYFTGDLFPISGKAVSLISSPGTRSIAGLFDFYFGLFRKSAYIIIKNNLPYIFAILVGAFSLSITRKPSVIRNMARKLAVFLPLLLFGTALFCAYLIIFPVQWFFVRYYYPLILLFFIVASVVVDSFIVELPGRFVPYISGVLIAFFVITCTLRPLTRIIIYGNTDSGRGYLNIGYWARDNFEDNTIIGSAQTGALGYLAGNLTVINLDGVVNRRAYDAMRQRRTIAYIKQSGIEYVLGWSINIVPIINESYNFSPGDLIFIKKIEYIKSWGYDWYLYRVGRDSLDIPGTNDILND